MTGPRAALTVINPSGQRTNVAVRASPFLIGRQSDNHLALRDNRVSRVHSRILIEEDGYYLEDLSSRHGAWVNGRRIDGRVKLFHSDSIHFGFADGYQLVFLQEDRDLARLVDHMQVTHASLGAGTALGKLRALVEVARALQSSLSIKEILDSVVEAALTVTGCERGFLLMQSGGELEVRVARDREGNPLAAGDLKVPTRLIEHALRSRRDLLSMHFDPLMEGATEADLSVATLDLRSVVCVPMVKVRAAQMEQTVVAPVNETVGLIYLDSRIDLADLSAGNREILQTLAIEASTVLENARLLEQDRGRQRLEEELRIARVIQQSLLPRSLPSAGWLQVAGSSTPSQHVGGDYFDVTSPDPSRWKLVVADVSGKGVSSALMASLLQGAFVNVPAEPAGIPAMLARVNAYLHERTEGEKYATLFYAVIERGGLMHWANAGHGSALVVHSDGSLEELESNALPVGLLEASVFQVTATRLRSGDKIVIYSDGLSEAANLDEELFTNDRIRTLAASCAPLAAPDFHTRLLDEIHQFTGGLPQRDDMTLVVAEFC